MGITEAKVRHKPATGENSQTKKKKKSKKIHGVKKKNCLEYNIPLSQPYRHI